MTDNDAEQDPTRNPADLPTPDERGGPPMAISEDFRRFEVDHHRASLFTDKVAFLLFALAAPAILLLLLGSGVIDPDLRDDVPGDPGDAVVQDRTAFEVQDRVEPLIRVDERSSRRPVVPERSGGESRFEVTEQAGQLVVERRSEPPWVPISIAVVAAITIAVGLWLLGRRRLGARHS